jgi:methionyl aminopeptidase
LTTDTLRVVSIESEEDLAALRRAGRVVAATLRELRRRVRPGVRTGELDRVAADVFRRHGARSAPNLAYGFPGTICISVNDEAVHGIPGPRRLRDGDLVKLDVTAELDGYYADAAVSVPVGRSRPSLFRLAAAAEAGLAQGLAAASAGAPLNAIGGAVQQEVERRGYRVLGELLGHGIGRSIHEKPDVPSVYWPELTAPLSEGLVLTVEPIIAAGGDEIASSPDDRWTIRTADGSLSAHAEHTIVVTRGRPLVLTAA